MNTTPPSTPPYQKTVVKLFENQKITSSTGVNLINLEYLGRGGNGAVHRMMVKDGELRGLIVAVKFLEAVEDKARVERFSREIETLQSLRHPNIVTIYDTGNHKSRGENLPFYVMEYQPRNLEQEMKSHPRGIHPDLVLPIALQIASALNTLHSKTIIHRDLKPSNILFDGANIRIADFGIARNTEDGFSINTVVGQRTAPYYYMSPEQWQWWKNVNNPQKVGVESDVYQFGLIIYSLASGVNPNTVWDWKENGKAAGPKIWEGRGSLINDLYMLVAEMVELKPDNRPTIKTVQDRLLSMFLSYSNHFAALYGTQPGRNH